MTLRHFSLRQNNVTHTATVLDFVSCNNVIPNGFPLFYIFALMVLLQVLCGFCRLVMSVLSFAVSFVHLYYFWFVRYSFWHLHDADSSCHITDCTKHSYIYYLLPSKFSLSAMEISCYITEVMSDETRIVNDTQETIIN